MVEATFPFPCQVGYLREVILKVLNLVLLFQSYWDNGIQNIRWGKTLSKYIFKMFPFLVASSLCFKARLKAKPLIWKCFFKSHANKTLIHKNGFEALSLGLKLIVFGTWELSVKTPRNYRGFQKLYFRPFLKSLKHFLLFIVSFIAHNFCYFKPVKSPKCSISIFSCIILSIHDQEITLWGSIKCSQKGGYFDPLSNSLQ